jgi:hypothetical protein
VVGPKSRIGGASLSTCLPRGGIGGTREASGGVPVLRTNSPLGEGSWRDLAQGRRLMERNDNGDSRAWAKGNTTGITPLSEGESLESKVPYREPVSPPQAQG